MGIDLEFADCAAARYRLDDCRSSGPVCAHEPGCAQAVDRVYAAAAAERPDEGEFAAAFAYRRFAEINETMRLTGMGFPAEPARLDDHDEFRTQTVPGRTGIPAFKLLSNDRWLVSVAEIDEALAAYAAIPAGRRAELETDARWAAWISWLGLARGHGGFEAE